ncbi:SDR family oxidoreductase [Methylomonas sp. YC3]
MARKRIGVLGATSHVGLAILPLLVQAGFDVVAFSRQSVKSVMSNVEWQVVQSLVSKVDDEEISFWICLAPIWTLPSYFAAIQASKAKRVVVLSSTSRFTKQGSSDPVDQMLAQRFVKSEFDVQECAANAGIECVILRPTLIYGLGRDKNICEIGCLIRRFHFFPLLGQAKGLRQPVHCSDVAQACVSALFAENVANKSYNLSGAEILSYRDMVARIFNAIGLKQRFIQIPMLLLRIGFVILKILPRYRGWSFSMMERTNHDLVFDHHDATRDLGFSPRPFRLGAEDLAIK